MPKKKRVVMCWDVGWCHMIVMGGRTVSTQSRASDHVKTSSRAVRSSSNGNSSSTRRLRFFLQICYCATRATAREARITNKRSIHSRSKSRSTEGRHSRLQKQTQRKQEASTTMRRQKLSSCCVPWKSAPCISPRNSTERADIVDQGSAEHWRRR